MAVHTCRREEEAHPQVSTSSGASHNGGRQQPQVLESSGVTHSGRRQQPQALVSSGATTEGVTCAVAVCGRSFRRPGDLKRHKCTEERRKPVGEQAGSVQCTVCQRWFLSAGGLSVHQRVHQRRS